ncbi:MAG TPA: ubiquinol-cytochrome C chaperone family protein [Sphingomicrobium sp.]
MLDFLFRRLTATAPRGAALFDAVTGIAREPHWYVEGQVPDTIDGRFAVLSTIIALILVRLEADGDKGDLVSVGLTEHFIEVMEAEHRELGLGDPTLGKTVRKLVGSLSRRTDRWRSVIAGEADWAETTRDSLYKENAPADALEHASASLQRLWERFEHCTSIALEQGQIR